MPARKSRTPVELTQGQAMYVLTRLVEDRRVSQTDVGRYVRDMDQEINTLEERLRELRSAQSGAAAKAGRRGRTAADEAQANGTDTSRRRTGGRKRRRQNLTPERIATLKLQGQYLAMMRRLSQRQRAQYKKLFREKGLEATVKALRETTQE
jgi:hypothetical protein